MPPFAKSLPADRPWRIALIILIVGFAAIRFACLFNDLWLDEIWSLWMVGQIHSPWEIFTRLRGDNNHPLNSLFLYLLMPAKAEWTYRLLSWATGSATVGLAAAIGRRQFLLLHPGERADRAQVAGLITATLVGASYFLILYAAEARGYAPAVFFGWLAFYALLRAPGRGWCSWTAVYWLAGALGLVSHAVAVQILLAGGGYAVALAVRSPDPWRVRLARLAWWHLPPGIFFCFYYAFVLRAMIPGGGTFLGGTHTPFGNLWGDLAAYSLGFPAAAGLAVALPVLLLITLVPLGLIWRRDRALAIFYALAVFVTPGFGLLSGAEPVLFPRYFIMSVAGGFLLAGYLFARIGSLRRWIPPAGLAALALYLLGNGVHVGQLLKYGRGQYEAALRYVVSETPTTIVTVSTDFSEFRNFMVINHYAARAAGPDRFIQYLPLRRQPAAGPQWLFVERLDHEPPAPASLYGSFGTIYRLERVFPHAALSGWQWFVYRNTSLLGSPPGRAPSPPFYAP
jgi:hypothetical protein